jgi:hypothetical protein
VIFQVGHDASRDLTMIRPLVKSDLLADLHHPVPARAFDRGAYELGADIALAWLSKSHRQLPTQRSATPFCHGLRKAVRVGWLPMSLTAETTSAPNLRLDRIARICVAVCRPMLLAVMPNSGLCRMEYAKHSGSKADLHRSVLLFSIIRHSPVWLTGL